MAAFFGRTKVGIQRSSINVSIANDPKAKLMYYLDCMCSVLDLSDTDNLNRLRYYGQYNSLTEKETDALVALCFLLSPDVLSGKVIFQDDSMCGDKNNEFYKIEAVRNNLVICDSIIIGGQRRVVSQIMAFKQQWLIDYWENPMRHFVPRLARLAEGPSNAKSDKRNCDDCCCVIL
ncbi:uncharacterized protein LOC132721954 [Ruditapes philippinarum]|uniref:uncharacterized protein LOC132721954 n=1 Tax=Ruditapes philippinarum TaxID=129788 RepID=UPI00295AB955|nr:uncharacterized protein LOC132721954 [Ruditapes philippinarum]